jgi:hypothetical protein
MDISKARIQSLFTSARTAFSGSQVVIRHKTREQTGTRTPFDKGEMVDEAGAIFTVTGGARLLTSEFASTWPKAGDEIQIKSTETSKWLTYVIISGRLDETEATMSVTYGERYDQEGL